MRLHRWSMYIVVAVAVFAFGRGAPALSSPEEGGGEYAGSDKCPECHEDQAKVLKQTWHGRKGFQELSSHGCETCHGPAKAHVADPSDETAAKLRIWKRSAKDQIATCQQCHDGAKQFFFRGGRHDSRGVSCINCHSVHSFKSESKQLKEKTVMDTCFQCHRNVRADLWKSSHHPVREGRITCADCHNPHGSGTGTNFNAATVNDLCYGCHTEKRGPFLWEHAPVRENCLNCHTPHGSNHIKLQRTSVPYLCQQCHANTRHPGTLYDAASLATAPGARNRLFNRGCPNCHANIHGSNHPSAPYFGK